MEDGAAANGPTVSQSQHGAPGHQAPTAPTFFLQGTTSAPLTGRESIPSQRLLG